MLTYIVGALGYNVPVAGNAASVVTAPYCLSPAFDGDIKEVRAGMYHSMILLNNGKIWMWGENQYGELGTAKAFSTEPVRWTPATILSTNPLFGKANHVYTAGNSYCNWAITNDVSPLLYFWG
jgi:alpha-tubulin suppressor-like RCC1 family protein